MKITGLKEIKDKLKKIAPASGKACERALTRGGLLILRESQQQVPVEFGNLKGSGFTRKKKSGFDAVVSIGYTADYAIYVHEDLDALHGDDFNAAYAEEIADPNNKTHSRGSGQKAKYLSDPLQANRKKITTMVANEVKKDLRKL